MDYRNERDALRGRVESLEQQLEEAKREARTREGGEDAARVAQIQAQIAEAEAMIHRIRAELLALGAAAPRPKPRVSGLVFVVAAVVLAGAGFAALRGMRAPPGQVHVAGPAPGGAVVLGPREAATVRAPVAADYFEDATSVPGMFKEKLGGPAGALSLVLYPGYVIAELQDPKKHQNVDRYTLRAGAVGAGDPVRLSGTMKTAKDVDEKALDLDTVDFGLVPKMIAEATADLPIEDGKVTHVYLEGSAKEAPWSVYVGSARDSGYVTFDLAGHRKRVAH